MGKLYFGNYTRSLDQKGRLQIPTPLFDEEEKELYVLRGLDGCISVYGESSFQDLLSHLKTLDFRDPEQRAYLRLSTASVKKLKVDAHGRILLGTELLRDYGMQTEVKIIGVLDHFEIWEPMGYAHYELAYGKDYESLARKS